LLTRNLRYNFLIMKTIKDVMQNFSSSCNSNDSLQKVASLMTASTERFLPVVNSHKQVIGIISDSDLQQALKKDEAAKNNLFAADLMKAESTMISAYDDEAAAFKIMRNNKSSYLPVVDHENHLKGVVSFFTLARRIIQLKNDLKKDDEKLRVRGLGLSV